MSDLEDMLNNTTTVLRSYDDLTRGSYLASIPIVKEIRGAPGIRHLSLEGKTDHGEALRNVLTFDEISDAIQNGFSNGEFRFNASEGFHGGGFNSLDVHTRRFLKEWESEYMPRYREFREHLDQHDEIKNYRSVMVGAITGVIAGAAVGTAIDGSVTLIQSGNLDSIAAEQDIDLEPVKQWLTDNDVWVEISARSLPALLEAEEIARPFFSRAKDRIKYRLGKLEEKPKPLTSTEIWALTQLAGPIVGVAMLVYGEATGLNSSPAYRGTAVVTINTGNNVIGAGSSWIHFYREVRKARFDGDPLYKDFKTSGKIGELIPNYAHNVKQLLKSSQMLKDIKDDVYLASCNFWANKFQSSNSVVAFGWYGIDVVLRSYGIAAEQFDFGGGFGGKAAASVESGLLSMDTAAAAKVAIEREKLTLHKEVNQLTGKSHLQALYLRTNAT
ncbi:hypothetical protein HYU09_05355 [Candidatus Woesearchaeota archaeon]|nr:hypothetical protein [Candidatus Woesearchaeota archaeon]